MMKERDKDKKPKLHDLKRREYNKKQKQND
jgi:hypothetical protein